MEPTQRQFQTRVPDVLKGRVTNIQDEYESKIKQIKDRDAADKTASREESSMKRERKRQQRSLTHGDVKGYDY